jgi:hypothetical protein
VTKRDGCIMVRELKRSRQAQLWGLLVLPVLGCWHSKSDTGVCWGYNILDRYSRYLRTSTYVRKIDPSWSNLDLSLGYDFPLVCTS